MTTVRFEFGLKPFFKHGEHDQSSHGNWAVGVSLEVASEIQRYTREWGGLSISMVDGHQPTIGFMVAKPPEFGKIVDEADFFDPDKGPKIMSQYMREQKADLATGKNYLGTWLKDGKIYLDVSENIMDRDEAIRLGQERNQKAIWDVVNQTEIETGGTGRVEKGNQDGGVEESRRYDGRGDRRLRTGSLAEVYGERQKTQVIRFDFGLKPVFKHEGGEGHDQQSHGNWARQGYTAEQAERISRIEGLGPTLDDMDKVVEGRPEVSTDDIRMLVENDRDLYSQATEDIDARVEEALARLQGEFPNHEYTEREKMEIYENVQRDMISDYISDNYNDLEERTLIESGRLAQASDLEDSFRDIYDVSVDYEDEEGFTATINSRISSVYQESENSIKVDGNIDVDGMPIGQFERVFYKNDDNSWSVEHKWLSIEDEYQGKGFAGKFIGQSEDYYTAIGIRDIIVTAGLEDGARHWARAGYDWDASTVGDSFRKLSWRVENDDSIKFTDQDKTEFESIWSRGAEAVTIAEGYPKGMKIKDLKSDQFPFPAEFASLGWDRRTKNDVGEWDWAGKRLMEGMVLDYRKPITAEGRNLLGGPIDADGDGLIYDGTARERPAPPKQ